MAYQGSHSPTGNPSPYGDDAHHMQDLSHSNVSVFFYHETRCV